jgi:acetyl-CoA acyltransferase
MTTCVVLDGARTPIGKLLGVFSTLSAVDLGGIAIKAAVERSGVTADQIDAVVFGNVVQAGVGPNPARQCAAAAGLPINIPAVTINKLCLSGLVSVAMAVQMIKAGQHTVIVAGGTESMSLVPMMGYKTALNWKIASQTPSYYLNMGLTAEELAKEYGITREEADAFSVSSHDKALAAIAAGKFKDEIVPVEVEETYLDEKGKKKTRKFTVDTDEGPRAGTTMEALAALKPAFRMGGQVTAGNSSQTSDGAAFVVVMSERLMKSLGLDPVARMLSYSVAGVDPRIMGIGPKEAVPKALKQAGLSMQDLGLVELNEAFAAQALAVIKSLDMDPSIVNVNGGAVALGHPLGCTGAKLSVQLFNELRRQNKKYGLVTACVGGGQGVAGIYELLK